MAKEAEGWIMHGIGADEPGCIKNADELIEYIDRVGFVPLFKNDLEGFSVEEHAQSDYWWTGNTEKDPWEWRMTVTKSRKACYGKFFDGKAGFVSLKWLPVFANYRRNGYDFDALWDDELAQHRQKKIMDCFSDEKEMFSFVLKEKAGFGKDGEKNFEGVMTSLQNSFYLVNSDFERRKNRKGMEYGWNIAKFAMPEDIWGYDSVTACYGESPVKSYEKIVDHIRELFPTINCRQVLKMVGKPPEESENP